MGMDTFSIQQDILEHAQQELDMQVFDNQYPDTRDEPTTNGVLDPYCVVLFSESWKKPTDLSFAGPRFDGMYSIVDFLVFAADPEEARAYAYGEGGVADVFTGWTPPSGDAGTFSRARGTRSFVTGDGVEASPARTIATVSFQFALNLMPSAD